MSEEEKKQSLGVAAVLAKIMLEIKKPDRRVSFREKVGWTLLILVFYLIMSELPLYGISGGGYDYLYWSRLILASSRGTVLELGIGPIVTAGLIMQLLVGSKIINWELSDPVDRKKFTVSQKFLSLVLAAVQAIMFIVAKAFGELTLLNSILVFAQLFTASYLVLLMDEALQKGWGIGSGISLFIAAGVSKSIMWGAFSVVQSSDGYAQGAVIQFFQSLLDGKGLGYAFFRNFSTPNMFGVVLMFLVLIFLVIMETTSVHIPISYAKVRGFRSSYPIRLLYISVIPVIMVNILYSDLLLIAQVVWASDQSGNWILTRILGMFTVQTQGVSAVPVPVSGLVYYLTPPRSLPAAISDPIRTTIYAITTILLAAWFAQMWIDIAGMSPADIADQIVSSEMQIVGFRRSRTIIEKVLERYIPVISVLGGIIVAILSVFSTILNVLGTGTGILLLVDIIYSYMQEIAKQYAESLHPAIKQFLGLAT